jgi:hypothetical protein
MSGALSHGTVAQKQVIAKYPQLAVTKPVVIAASAGVNGARLSAGQLLQKIASGGDAGKYLPIVTSGTPDVAAIGTTVVLAQSITLDGEDKTNVSAFYGGYMIKSALIGTSTQIGVISKDVEDDVVVLKQW